jgi:hypothetical protein
MWRKCPRRKWRGANVMRRKCPRRKCRPAQVSHNLLAYLEDNLLSAVARGALSVAAMYSIQLSTLFLIINRIQAILFPSLTLTRYRYWCQYASVITFSISFIYIFVVTFRRAYWPSKILDTGEFFSRKFFCLCDFYSGLSDLLLFWILLSKK